MCVTLVYGTLLWWYAHSNKSAEKMRTLYTRAMISHESWAKSHDHEKARNYSYTLLHSPYTVEYQIYFRNKYIYSVLVNSYKE